ncbi:MAG: glycosyltransferase family 4 protein [Candidatus Bipolaricaulia bacterium]
MGYVIHWTVVQGMRICLYLEAENISVSGILTAFRQQVKALKQVGVELTTDFKDDHDLLHLHRYGPKSLYYLKRARTRGRPVVITAHSTAEDFQNSFTLSNTFAPFIGWYLRFFYEQCDHIITPSEYTRDLLRRHGTRGEFSVVSNGVDLECNRFSAEKRRRFRETWGLEGPVALSVGRVFPRKGVIDFIKVAAQLPEVTFVWCGPRLNRLISFYPEMERRIRERSPNVRFLGFVPDIQAAYAAADVFFFPSHEENQGIVLLESAAIGVPIVTRDLPVYQGWLVHGENCFKGKTVEEFRDHIQKLLDDEERRTALVAEGKQLAETHRLERIGGQLVAVYRSLLDGSAESG